jgi:hypothetical protein
MANSCSAPTISKIKRIVVPILLIVFASSSGWAKKPPKKRAAKDRIQVVAKLPITGGPVTRLITTIHEGEHYIYAEHASQRVISLIDVTEIQHPGLVSTINLPGAGNSLILAATGDAALVSEEIPGNLLNDTHAVSTKVAIVNFADHQHPDVLEEITGVTAIAFDDSRGLIFLANADGLWILHRAAAPDPKVEEFFEHEILGNH